MKFTAVLLIVYYITGSIMLPAGNFSIIQFIPEIYAHCKAFEDKDMGALDFITDHLINIDTVFDNHGKDDEQKPHTPIPHMKILINSFPTITAENEKILCWSNRQASQHQPWINKYEFNLFQYIFRPPIQHA